ncbi:uncharacterized protein EDB91DRAFT_1198477 [Suillus paluster]|uniref:uncharacterized protein n=1 Tax=Suillus paluster TaxID=48578 RepID=UPI001B86ECC7|nr:uncharacterized protein EDB91DRAFT_1198477 [Suillus paluster]KAG1747962.1 hypothetical protein EDB91DRAFT_1198477 [Suillus paluster]
MSSLALATNMHTAESNVNLSQVWNIIGELQIVIPDLETPYSRASFPNTNYFDTESKDQTISAIITERQQQRNAVLDEISGLETVMHSIDNLRQQLVEKKDKITQSMNLHKRFASTLWRLPTEVLSQIFHHCLPTIPAFDELQLSSRLEAPMMLTAVCRRWREVAVDTPNLWCKLHVPIVSRDHWEGQAFCCHSWLKRSRGLPLSLALQYYGDSFKLRSLLQPYINQISSLHIHIFPDADELDVLLEDLAALQDLTIVIEDRDMAFDTRSIDEEFSQSISQLPFTLRSLTVVGLYLKPNDISSVNPVWAHLTNVDIEIHKPRAFLHLLQLGPNISSLKVRVESNRTRAFKPFTHTKLQSLRIGFGNSSSNPLLVLFNALTLPNLRILEVNDVRVWPHEELKALLSRSKCTLETLIFGPRVKTTEEQRAEYVALIPSLEVVALEYGFVDGMLTIVRSEQ